MKFNVTVTDILTNIDKTYLLIPALTPVEAMQRVQAFGPGNGFHNEYVYLVINRENAHESYFYHNKPLKQQHYRQMTHTEASLYYRLSNLTLGMFADLNKLRAAEVEDYKQDIKQIIKDFSRMGDFYSHAPTPFERAWAARVCRIAKGLSLNSKYGLVKMITLVERTHASIARMRDIKLVVPMQYREEFIQSNYTK